ncbi:hypothetical protein C6P96_15560 [Burkholderia multivorans]|nr:hypothetical protein C6P95_22510 [Burkholderia multivorans]PRF11634.1 hypothetical protein C6P96_15560 [Burkholderia multivorans]
MAGGRARRTVRASVSGDRVRRSRAMFRRNAVQPVARATVPDSRRADPQSLTVFAARNWYDARRFPRSSHRGAPVRPLCSNRRNRAPAPAT